MAEPPVLQRRAVRRAFGRAAARYELAAHLQREVGSRLLEHLDPMRVDPARIVDLGCGTGVALDALARRFPKADLIGLDLAPEMLRVAAGRGRWWQRALGARLPRMVCGDWEQLPLAAHCAELAFSNLALQWCRPERAFPEAARVLSTGGLFLFSTFGPDTLKELRAAFAEADGARHVHTFIDMHDLGDALVHSGFADPVMDMELLTVEYASVEDVARDLKAIGAANALAGRPRGLMGRQRWQRMTQAYEALRRAGSLPATFEVIYGHAWKVAPRKSADGRPVIQFHRGTPGL